MAANIITFDSEYMRECARNVENAAKLVDEARESLKRANRHDGWRCPERHNINNSLGDISARLDRISNGLNETSSSLIKGAGQFAELESRAQKDESVISAQSKKNSAYTANNWSGGKESLNTCQIPAYQNRQPVNMAPSIYSNQNQERNKENVMFALKAGTYVAAQLIGMIGGGAIGLLGGVGKGLLAGSESDILIKGAAGGAAGMFEGGQQVAKDAMNIFEHYFGKDSRGLLDSDRMKVQSTDELLGWAFSMGNSLPVYDNYVKDKLF